MKDVAYGYLTRAAVVLFWCLVGATVVSPATAEAQAVSDSTAFPLVLDAVLDSVIVENRANVRVEPRPLPASWEAAYAVDTNDLIDDASIVDRRLAQLRRRGLESIHVSALEDCTSGAVGYPRPVPVDEVGIAAAQRAQAQQDSRSPPVACVFIALPQQGAELDGEFRATVVVTSPARHGVFSIRFLRSPSGHGWELNCVERVLEVWS